MIERLRDALYPQIEFEQRVYRRRLALLVLALYFAALGLWLAGALIMPRIGLPPAPMPIVVNMALAGLGLLLGVAAALLVRSDRPLAAGYTIATAAFMLAALNLLLSPTTIPMTTVMLLSATLLAGTVISGGAAYLFAGGAAGLAIAGWTLAATRGIGAMASMSPQAAFIYVVSVPAAAITTAIVIHTLSRQVQRTIERLHNQAQRLASLANTDPLTLLANRRYLLDQLERELARARRYGRPLILVYLDLDGFKEVNDRFGHLFGDEVLKGAAKSLSAVLRATDLFARIGGDEFAILMPETSIRDAKIITEKLRRALTAYGDQMNSDLPSLSFCAGVAELEQDDETIEAILQRADNVLYLAKAAGRGLTRTQSDLGKVANGGA